jgi:hypothetical protein
LIVVSRMTLNKYTKIDLWKQPHTLYTADKHSQKERSNELPTCGGLFFGIRKRTLIGWRSAYGGSPFAISIAVIPRDQISACTWNKVLA